MYNRIPIANVPINRYTLSTKKIIKKQKITRPVVGTISFINTLSMNPLILSPVVFAKNGMRNKEEINSNPT